MCSDGLTNMLSDKEIMSIVINNLSRLDIAIQSLVDRQMNKAKTIFLS